MTSFPSPASSAASGGAALRIDYYLSPMSPWVHLAGTRPAELARRHAVPLRYLPVDPAALFARTGGLPLRERHQSRRTYRLQELRRWARKRAIPMVIEPAYFPTNPAPASYALIAAQQVGGGDMAVLLNSLTRACWEEERDIAEDSVIGACLAAAGFDPGLTLSGLLAGAETYARNLEQAVAAGVFGFPFFVVGEEMFWGQDRLDDLDAHLAHLAPKP